MNKYILISGQYRYQLCDGNVYELVQKNGNVLSVKNKFGYEQKVFDFCVVASYDSEKVAKKVAKELTALWKELQKAQQDCLRKQHKIVKGNNL